MRNYSSSWIPRYKGQVLFFIYLFARCEWVIYFFIYLARPGLAKNDCRRLNRITNTIMSFLNSREQFARRLSYLHEEVDEYSRGEYKHSENLLLWVIVSMRSAAPGLYAGDPSGLAACTRSLNGLKLRMASICQD